MPCAHTHVLKVIKSRSGQLRKATKANLSVAYNAIATASLHLQIQVSRRSCVFKEPDLPRFRTISGQPLRFAERIIQVSVKSEISLPRLTDVSGTENEVVPLNTRPGTTHELTCPDSSRYFHHDGLQTTAHYYVNRKGISKESACIWGKDGTSQGNWAPTVFGVGKDSNGRTWLSIATTTQNNPTAYKPLDYTVTLEGQLGGKCRVQNGQYCWGDNYESCNESGCTVRFRIPKFDTF